MRVADLLRTLADKLDGIEQGASQEAPPQVHSVMPQQAIEPHAVPTVDQKPDLVVIKVDNEDSADSNTMASPLQQELEIMKKAAGIPSAFDGQQ